MAGTIAQSTGNDLGVAGVAHGASIMPLRVLGGDGSGSDWDVAQALRFAADYGAAVTNLSLGGPTGSAVVADAVTYAHAKGVVIVASSGNDGVGQVSYPAAYVEAVAVGAVRYDRTRGSYSNYGSALALVAPGGDLSVDQNGDGFGDGVLQQTLRSGVIGDFCYCFMQGTSMAAPHVAAVAAMIVADGTTDPTAVRAALESSAADLGAPGWDTHHGAGLIQAADALAAAAAARGATGLVGVGARDIDDSCPPDLVPRGVFDDVSASDTHGLAIDCIAWWNVSKGTTATTYEPAGTASRAHMASFVARTIEGAGYPLALDPPDAFADDDGSPHEHRINQLADAGVVKGVSSGRYAPGAEVTRAAMATFLVRAYDLISDADLADTGNWFDDDDDNTHEPNIDKAAGAGLAAGTGTRTFSPGASVRRDQMASFLARTLDLLIESGSTPPPV